MTEVINFAGIAPQQLSGGDIFGNYAEGKKLASAIEQAKALAAYKAKQAENYDRELESKMAYQAASGEHLRQDAARMAKDMSNPYWNVKPTGNMANAWVINSIKQRYGENSPEYRSAKQSYDASMVKDSLLNQYRQSLIESAPKRNSTDFGKTIIESREANSGYTPGTDRKETLSPQEQERIVNEYDRLRLNKSSDQPMRTKSVTASNIDKTIANIDLDALTQYAGIPGMLQKGMDMAHAAIGKSPERYTKYSQALVGAKGLAKQIRALYGDSIQPANLEEINNMVNPATWHNNPELAKAIVKKYLSILQQESGTFKDALHTTAVYDKPREQTANRAASPKNYTEADVQGLMQELPTWSEARIRRLLDEKTANKRGK